MNIAGQRRPACVTRLNCEFRGALVTVNRRWPPSVCFLQHTSTRQGSGTAHRLLVWLGVGIAILSCASTAASAGEGAVRFAEDTTEDFLSCVRATVEKAAWCSRSPTVRCTTRPSCFLSEIFFGYSAIGSRSAAPFPRTLEASLDREMGQYT